SPPYSRIGPLTAQERAEHLARSPLAGRYDTAVDRESAHELLAARAAATPTQPEPKPEPAAAPARVRRR
ncbi:MAG TPA: ATP-binding protein, partial [Gammaproteobacteria bacterium]|nr:ATP-binding protein [Gammaproteobacteria bacterium]